MPQKKKTYLLLFVFMLSFTASAQLTFFGDLYISEGSEIHVAFKETYFNGGRIITSRAQNPGILSFGKESLWKQLQHDSFVDGVVRIYHEGDFTFPIGEGNLFSPLTFYPQKSEEQFEVYYQKYDSQLYPTLSDNFRVPQFHFWNWKTSPSTLGTIKIYWNNEHNLHQLELDGQMLKLEAGGSVDLGIMLNQAQKLELNGTLLSLERGGSVDLSTLFSSSKDNQMLHLNSAVLSLDRGGSVDLSNIISPTMIQKIDRFQLSGSTLELSLSQDEETVHQVDLSGVKSEDQSLSISQTTLSLSRGGSVDLLPILEYVEAQNIEFSTPSSQTLNLGITKGNELNIEANELLSFSKKDSSTLVISAKNSTFTTSENITSNASQQWDQDDFVFGSIQLDNDPNVITDNKRFFFDKSKGAFRAGITQSDQWDEKNLGTYSTAFGRNSIASNFHSVAFGLSTESRAWYSTAMGIGTIAPSRAETVIGSYNTEYTPLGGTNRWDSQDRLFVVGNGEGSSTVRRSDALVIYKDGSTSTSGIWSGPGFYTTSSKSEKMKLSKLTLGIEILEKLIPYQYELKRLPDQLQFGFLAEELEAIVPNLVYESQGVKSVNYQGLIPILVNVLIHQQQEIERLKDLHIK